MKYKKILLNKFFIRILILLIIIIPLTIAVTNVWMGNINLWYDNARDLLSAWDNLHKLTLIGPPSGIPGIFYGPYWVWLLSFGLLFSKDPRVVILVTATIPYFIIFTLLWFRLGRLWGETAVLIGWILFIFSTGMTYATQLWNPYPAPLIALAIIYLLLTVNFTRISYKTSLQSLLLGFLLGLLINFSVSFGIGFSLGVFIFWVYGLLSTIFSTGKFRILSSQAKEGNGKSHTTNVSINTEKITRNIQQLATKYYSFNILCIILGFLTAFIPFFLFEIRHGFHQIRTVLTTLSQYGNVVTVHGLTKPQILQQFFISLATILHTSLLVSIFFILFILILFVIRFRLKKITFTEIDRRILTLLACLFAGICFIYFSARNPVWSYHFIGIDVLFLVLITFLLAKISFLRYLFLFWTIFIVLMSITTFIMQLETHQVSALAKQKQIVDIITTDAGKSNYEVIAYSPSIYMYEYTYLFRWLANKYVPYDPSQNFPTEQIVYLILPHENSGKISDFIQYRTPNMRYRTVKRWEVEDANDIIKRKRV